jgi:hypothetical protein
MSLSETNVQAAKASAPLRALSAAKLEFEKYGTIPAGEANKYYDELTDHGRNAVASSDAVRLALARFQTPLVEGVTSR